MSNNEKEYNDDDSKSSDNKELVQGSPVQGNDQVTSLSRNTTFLKGKMRF